MIVFDLRCANGHVFEAWFASSAAFEEQRGRGLLCCAVCEDRAIGKAVMAPNVSAKGNTRDVAPRAAPGAPMPPEVMKAAIQALAAAQARALETSEWVGRSFASRARAMHEGDETEAPIHGQATIAEAKALVEEGVPVAPLLLPVVPPDALN
ncbi:DUF1178 family protein [Sphingomonas aracearum]|uniref:DUF1178 family protein n=1 Tax=Sphingomonas aracearum TaxID=2283317 RepID=A0A369VSB5_9SPHN|nr:DUF1178 family protein [Sphingomonas aracearum]RDE05278.1 DUF1178 family protein [Sphingomonas aracearum]